MPRLDIENFLNDAPPKVQGEPAPLEPERNSNFDYPKAFLAGLVEGGAFLGSAPFFAASMFELTEPRSPGYRDLMMQQEYAERADPNYKGDSFTDVLSSPRQFLEKAMQMQPNVRPDAKEIGQSIRNVTEGPNPKASTALTEVPLEETAQESVYRALTKPILDEEGFDLAGYERYLDENSGDRNRMLAATNLAGQLASPFPIGTGFKALKTTGGYLSSLIGKGADTAAKGKDAIQAGALTYGAVFGGATLGALTAEEDPDDPKKTFDNAQQKGSMFALGAGLTPLGWQAATAGIAGLGRALTNLFSSDSKGPVKGASFDATTQKHLDEAVEAIQDVTKLPGLSNELKTKIKQIRPAIVAMRDNPELAAEIRKLVKFSPGGKMQLNRDHQQLDELIDNIIAATEKQTALKAGDVGKLARPTTAPDAGDIVDAGKKYTYEVYSRMRKSGGDLGKKYTDLYADADKLPKPAVVDKEVDKIVETIHRGDGIAIAEPDALRKLTAQVTKASENGSLSASQMLKLMAGLNKALRNQQWGDPVNESIVRGARNRIVHMFKNAENIPKEIKERHAELSGESRQHFQTFYNKKIRPLTQSDNVPDNERYGKLIDLVKNPEGKGMGVFGYETAVKAGGADAINDVIVADAVKRLQDGSGGMDLKKYIKYLDDNSEFFNTTYQPIAKARKQLMDKLNAKLDNKLWNRVVNFDPVTFADDIAGLEKRGWDRLTAVAKEMHTETKDIAGFEYLRKQMVRSLIRMEPQKREDLLYSKDFADRLREVTKKTDGTEDTNQLVGLIGFTTLQKIAKNEARLGVTTSEKTVLKRIQEGMGYAEGAFGMKLTSLAAAVRTMYYRYVSPETQLVGTYAPNVINNRANIQKFNSLMNSDVDHSGVFMKMFKVIGHLNDGKVARADKLWLGMLTAYANPDAIDQPIPDNE